MGSWVRRCCELVLKLCFGWEPEVPARRLWIGGRCVYVAQGQRRLGSSPVKSGLGRLSADHAPVRVVLL